MLAQPRGPRLRRTRRHHVGSDVEDALRDVRVPLYRRWHRRECGDPLAPQIEALEHCVAARAGGEVNARPTAPWATVTPEATATCLRSFDASLLDATDAPHRADHDRRLELLSRRLAAATSEAELDACLFPLADELHADEIRLVPAAGQSISTTQLLVGDPHANPLAVHELRARGFSSRLALPITHGGQTLGYLEACCRNERPWSRFEIGRARIITHQLGPLRSSMST